MATIRDVAKASGVSVATVSYVLNNGPRPVRPQTRERVLAVMRHLNYHPNAMARGLIRRRMNTVGVLFGQIESAIVTNPYAASVLQGILSAAAELNYNVTLFPKQWVNVRHSAAAIRDRRTDGVLVIAPLDDSDMVPGLAALGVPMVVVSGLDYDLNVPSFDVDNIAGARLAVEYLLSLGHRRIGHISGSLRFDSARTRRKEFLETLKAAGITVPDEYIVEGDYSGYGDVPEILRRFLALPDPPTALFAGNDQIALTILNAANAMNIAIPQRISLIGFDDIPLAPMLSPPLTTSRQPLDAMGALAVRKLVNLIEGASVSENPEQLRYLAKPELIIRKTTGPPTV